MRALSDPDAFPAGDLALLRAAGMKTPTELERHAERWRPWRAYAAMHIWQGVQDGTIGLYYTWMESPTGKLLLAADEAGLRHIIFADGREPAMPRPTGAKMQRRCARPSANCAPGSRASYAISI